MDTFLVNEMILVPILIMPSGQIAKVLAGMLTFGKAVGKELGHKGKP